MNTTLVPAASLFIRSLGWALLYSVGEGLLIFTALYVLLKLTKLANSSFRYILSYASLLALFIWFVNTWASQWQRLKGITIYITQSGAGLDTQKTYSINTLQHDVPGIFHNTLLGLDQYIPAMVIIYMAGLAFMLLRFAINIRQIHILRRKGLVLASGQLDETVSNWREQFNIIQPIRLYFSEHIHVPAVMGVLKPIILLPVSVVTQLDPEQMEAVILHELAHVKRNDYLLNLFQTCIETILFFNPFIWLISRIVRKEREHCCDDIVLEHTSGPLAYARALALLERSRQHTNDLALGAAGNKDQLLNRIKRIMEMKKNTPKYNQVIIALVAVIAMAISIVWFTPSLAQIAKKNKPVASSTSNEQQMNNDAATDTASHGKSHSSRRQNFVKIDVTNDENDNDNISVSADIDTVAFSNMARDMAKMGADIAAMSLRSVDSAMKHIDWNQINIAIDNAGKEIDKVDWGKIQDEVNENLKNTDAKTRREVKLEIKKELDESRKEIEEARVEINRSRRKHVEAIAKSHTGSSFAYSYDSPSYEFMLGNMEKEGLIDRKQGFKIKKENGEMYINDKVQPAYIYNKYRSYLDGNKILISGGKGNLNVNIEN